MLQIDIRCSHTGEGDSLNQVKIQFRTPFILMFFAMLSLLTIPADAADWVSPGGAGSYAVTKPADGKRPDGGSVKMVLPSIGPNVDPSGAGKRKVPTSDWWTPLAWLDEADLPDRPADMKTQRHALCWELFSEPLVFQPQKGGLAVSLNVPDSRRSGMKGSVLTAGAGFMQEVIGDDSKGISPYFNTFFDQDLYLGSTLSGWNEAAYSGVKVAGWSDWFVNFSMTSAAETMNITAGNESPFLLVKLANGAPQVTFQSWNIGKVIPLEGDSFQVNSGMANGQAISSPVFAVINQVPFGKAQIPDSNESKDYSTYTVYAVFGPSGSTWTLDKNQKVDGRVLNTAVCSGGKHYAVAVLPCPWGKTIYDEPSEADVRKLLSKFASHAFSEVTDTRVAPKLSGSSVTVSFTYTTGAVTGESPSGEGTLYAMYPHQYLDQSVTILDRSMNGTSSSSWTNGWYWPSLKGPLLLASGNTFTNTYDVPPCLPAVIDKPEKAKADRMLTLLKQALDTQDPNFLSQGSYFGAQEMHRLAMLLPVAEMTGNSAETTAKDIYKRVTETLGYRLRATLDNNTTFKNAAQHALYYDTRWGSMIPSCEDGFAADSLLNDHHFHFGYYVKTAVEIARWEKTHESDPDNLVWAENYAPMIRLLIKDIANIDRTGTGADPDFPFLRHFSPYAGHSWASGSSRGNQGGQQESTSEAIQAWAALLLWAQLNYPADASNAELEKWAAYMFASEVRAAELYWFGYTTNEAFRPFLSFRQYEKVSDPVPLPYVPSMVSQINQNEMTFQTDFGNPPLLKHGIQWLPLTGSSLYLGVNEGALAEQDVMGYVDNDWPKLGAGQDPPSPSDKDKLLMMKSLTKSYKADARALITPDTSGAIPLDNWQMQWEIPAPTYDTLILQDTSRAAIFWWIDSHLSHGTATHAENDADHISAASFINEDGDKVYVAHNPGTTPLTVGFDDGKTLVVPALGYAHEVVPSEGSGGCSAGFPALAALLTLPALMWLIKRRR